MGVHSGPVVAGVVGTKIPHYSVFGETVDMAGLMEAAGEPMKIQVNQFESKHIKFNNNCNGIDHHFERT